MRLRWRLPVVLTACVVVAQLFALDPLVDVVTWTAPTSARLSYPHPPRRLRAAHPAGRLAQRRLAPRPDRLRRLGRFSPTCWYASPCGARRPPAGAARGGVRRRVRPGALAAFVAWGYWLPRPIPRLVATDPDVLVLDVHSHTAMSHDGRPGFGAAQNAGWHARAGFDAAFVTDHNVFGAATIWRLRGRRAPSPAPGRRRAVALGTAPRACSARWARSPTSRTTPRGTRPASLIRALHADSALPRSRAFPEYWEHHWGAELGELSDLGRGRVRDLDRVRRARWTSRRRTGAP